MLLPQGAEPRVTARVSPVIWLLVLAIVVAGRIGGAPRDRAVRRAIPGVLDALDRLGREVQPAVARVRRAADELHDASRRTGSARTSRPNETSSAGTIRPNTSSDRTMNLGAPEILVILVVALLVFGPHRLPEIGRQVGGAMRELRKMQDSVKSELNAVMRRRRRRATAPSP